MLQKYLANFEKQVVFQNVKIRVCIYKMLNIWSYDLAILRLHQKKIKTYIYTKICTQMFIATLFLIAQGRKNPRSINWWKDKQNVTYLTVEYYSTIERNGILVDAAIGMNFKNIMKKARLKSTQIIWFHLLDMYRVGKFIEKETRLVVTRGWEKGRVGSMC